MALVNSISARKISRREVGGPAPAQRLLQAAVEQLTGGDILPPPLTSFERFQPESA
jgi:hypothetical protein